MVGVALSLGVFLWMAGSAAHQHWFRVDYGTRGIIQLARSPQFDAPMQMLSILGERSALIPLIVLTSLLLWRLYRPRWALALPVIMAGTGWLQLVAKWAVNRPRPNLAAWGFPSGHVLSLVVFFGIVAYLLYTSPLGRTWRYLGGTVGAVTVPAVAFSRLYLDAHWLSDVVAGFLLGLAYLLFTIWLGECLRHRRLRRAVVPLTPPEWAADVVDSLAGDQATTPA